MLLFKIKLKAKGQMRKGFLIFSYVYNQYPLTARVEKIA